ncbi:transglutaminase domain-containing protein [Planctomycetota bacterium]|nr:transglutaminase domain-containing protein [Planctomycetota bacterium]
MNTRRIVAALTVMIAIAFAVQAQDAEPETPSKPALEKKDSAEDEAHRAVREYVRKKYFTDIEASDTVIADSIERLQTPESILAHIRRETWEAGQLDRFASNKLHFILKTPTGEVRSLVFRDGKKRKDKLLTPERERILRRLYAADAFKAAEHKLLAGAREEDGLEPASVLEQAIGQIGEDRKLDPDTLKRARKNLTEAKEGGLELAIALKALGKTEDSKHSLWAGVWLISRLDKMSFRRKDKVSSIPDAKTYDAQTFFENVHYATLARRQFPWGKDCTDDDFLQHVLSPRGSGEPLQRWRRHFYSAIAPELKDKKAEDAKDVIKMVIGATYDFFQYEGDTTWEDFGMLTALAVHEGRCEDCSNVENCMLRSVGFPAAQAFTPWWGHSNGNHAWTVIPSVDGSKNGNGKKALKVFVKTWDKYVDVTAANTDVTTIEVTLDDSVSAERAAMHVWNHEEWRVIARADVKGAKAVFENVGCARNFIVKIGAEGSTDKLFRIVDGQVSEVGNPETVDVGEKAFQLALDKDWELGEFEPDEEYEVQIHTAKGWQKIEAEREQTGAVGFECDPNRLYRIVGKGIKDRPFAASELDGELTITRF